jgi:hypothetical protein
MVQTSERVPLHANSTKNLISQLLMGSKLKQNPTFGFGMDSGKGDFKVPK